MPDFNSFYYAGLALFAIVIIFALLGKQKSARCPNCGSAEKPLVFSEVIDEKFGYQNAELDEPPEDETTPLNLSTKEWQTPVAYQRVRTYKTCIACHFQKISEEMVRASITQSEIHERTKPAKQIVRERLRARCNYCGCLYDPIKFNRCPSCGARA